MRCWRRFANAFDGTPDWPTLLGARLALDGPMLRAVLDTNVWLNTLLARHHIHPILRALRDRRFRLVTSEALIRELLEVLGRPEWQTIVTPANVHGLLAILRDAAEFVLPLESVTICDDPTDAKFIDCALAGHVDYLVTGDRDLLRLHPFRGIAIVRPGEFLRELADT